MLKITEFEEKYKTIIEEGMKVNLPSDEQENKGKRGSKKKSKPFNLLVWLKKYRGDILRFMYNSIVPFTNNLAERNVRMMKVQQKISGTFRSFEGAIMFGRRSGYTHLTFLIIHNELRSKCLYFDLNCKRNEFPR
ncbi:IS66 family transposase [Methanolacinia petrolearia]|uniref:IS66 family transposase n=1 Tax=Methanolacinia petrolearia TaxID=54120 RepID=UPI00068B32B2|nr:transposase [Methanolacinia petrolearia]